MARRRQESGNDCLPRGGKRVHGGDDQRLADLRERIFYEIKIRTQETDLSVPSRKDTWWYYSRTVEGQQYGI